MRTVDEIRAMLIGAFDIANDGHRFDGEPCVRVHFCYASQKTAIRLSVCHDRMEFDAASSGSDFLAFADAYTRAAAFVRALGMPVK